MYPVNDFIILPENIKNCSECGDQIFAREGSAPICDKCWNKVKPKSRGNTIDEIIAYELNMYRILPEYRDEYIDRRKEELRNAKV